jgi:hypothetical protein
MNKIIHLVISDNIFGGFEHYVRLTPTINSINKLIESILIKLRKTLILYKLEKCKSLITRKKISYTWFINQPDL